jgi:hypothetical protein
MIDLEPFYINFRYFVYGQLLSRELQELRKSAGDFPMLMCQNQGQFTRFVA